MDVCRIIKADISVKVGEIITTSKFERKYSEGRAIAESLLEDIRKCECPEMLDRKNSLFVFPMMINWKSAYFIGLVLMLLIQLLPVKYIYWI